MGSLKQLPFSQVENLTFAVYSDEEIEKLSVLAITNENSTTELGHVVENGIYDLRLGPTARTEEFCKTCNNTYYTCSGHCGHIELPFPVFNVFFIDVIKDLLHRICFSCFRFQVKASRGIVFTYESLLCSLGYVNQALEVSNAAFGFLACPNEAIEISVGVDDEESEKQPEETEGLVLALHKMLKKKVAHIKKNEEASSKKTSNSEAAALYIHRKFLDDTRPVKKKCMYCSYSLHNLQYTSSQLVMKQSKKSKDEDFEKKEDLVKDSQPYLTPKQAQEILRECYIRDGYILKHLYPFLKEVKTSHPTDLFFIKNLMVIPPRFRPMAKLGASLVIESEMSTLYKSVLRLAKCLRFLVQYKDTGLESIPEEVKYFVSEFKGSTVMEKCHSIWKMLQNVIDNILDAEINPSVRVVARGVRQIVEKKFGLFRQNLMGKRVNFSARSVAAPDPMLDVDEVGVPEEFALKLTYPVPVTPWNVAKLRKLVENGPLNYPGALFIEDQEGKKITLKAGDPQQRIAVASSLLTPTESCAPKVNAAKIVYRHLQNGDYVLMNRQPTLHKPSIQAHRARIMKKDRVLRMPYANCKAYNADFDGDELNLHFPQNEMTRSESEIIVTSRRQYLTQKDGSPLAGLIQDSIVSSVTLTVRGKFFGKEDYQQLVYVALSDQVRKLKLLKPAILKPQQLWSGKQVLSTIIMNLIQEQKAKPTFKFKTTVKVDLWQQSKNRVANTDLGRALDQMTESELVMRGGELLCGVIDKCAIGSTSHGLIHLCYELYGPNLACKLLTAVNRLCVAFLQWSGHTISLKEFVTTRLASRRRRKALNKLIKEAESEVSVRLGVPQGELQSHFETVHKSDNTNDSAALDAAYTAVLGPATSSITMDNEKRIIRNGLKNRMRMMVDTGAKGSKVNMNQMSSLFGSVAIDGKRMPLSVTGKSLPVFRSYDCDPRAGGYISTRFVTGMDPKSYFFLCIVGRDSLQHTAVKTANSGYMQRCLIKHLEGIKVEYDMTVRNSDGLVLQFEYGEDGMDVSKMPFMRNVDTMDIFAPNFAATIDSAEMDVIRKTKNAEVPQYKKKVKKYLKKVSTKERRSPFLNFSRNSKLDLDGIASEAVFSRLPKATSLLNKWNKLSHKEKSLYWSEENDSCKRVDPVASVFNGSLSVGAISESLEDLIENYYNKKYSVGVSSEKSSVLSKKEMKDSLYVKAFKSRVEPGEAVGAICAQAIGEPLTQMTLNTFHFAGRDELNVTLGVPRMIEILRVASEKIATPIMEVPFKQGMSQSIADKLKRTLTPVVLKDVLHKCSITTWLQRDSTIVRYCEITFELLPRNEYKHTFIVKPEGVLAYMEKVFFRKIIKEVKAAINRANLYASSNRSEGSKEADAGDEEKDDGEGPSSKAFGQCGLGDGDSSEEEDNVADEDVANAKRMTTKKEQDYSEDEEAINEQDQEAAQDQEDEAEVKKLLKGNLESKKEWIENETGAEVEEGYRQCSLKQKKGRETTEPSEYAMRTSFVKSTNSWIVGYDYDRSKNLWCKITLGLPIAEGRYDLSSIIQNLSETSLVHAVPGVKKALVVNKDDQLLLRTEGVNIHRMYSFEHILDVNKLYTNNIQLMAQRYGIEAAQRAIIKEICEVQSAYDIKVDFRHLSLLADYFTREGVYKACSRFALRSCASPIQKMSYETCFDFMQKALLGANCDDISSPSAKVMLGQPVEVGTNTMQILCNLKA